MIICNLKRLIFIVVLGCLITSPALGFNIEQYYAKHGNQKKETFIKNFPYYTYLKQVGFTDFKQLQQDRRFLWKKFGDGDDFLYYLGEHFTKYYPVQVAHLTDTIEIGEAYIADKQRLGMNNTTNEIYQIIGYYILGKVAQKLKAEIRKGNFTPETPQNNQILKRLEENRVYVTIERGTLQNLIYNFQQGKWEYILNRVWLKFTEVEQDVIARYDELLGPEFFEDFFKMENPPEIPKTESTLKLTEYRKYYPMRGGKEYEVNLFTVQDTAQSSTIGHAIWLTRPNIKATYFAYRNVTAKYKQWAARNNKKVVLATTGGFTNVHKKPEGLTVEKGTIVNAVLMPDRDGLVIVHKSGGISVINLKRKTIKLALGSQTVLTIENPLRSLIAYSKLLHWCREHKATLFQTQLLAFSDQLLIDVTKAKGQLRERRLLGLVRDRNTRRLHHVIFDIPKPHNLAVIAKNIFDVLKSRRKKIEAILNLDVGSYNILNVFDQQGKLLSKPRGPVNINAATNLIIYSY